MFDLSDKVVLITGAGNEVGYGIASVLAKFGATIIACDENKKKAEQTCEVIFKCGGIGVPVCFNVNDKQATTISLSSITEKLGSIDIMIYATGTITPTEMSSLAMSGSLEQEDSPAGLDFHNSGFLNCCLAVLEPMVNKNWGRIIKINSSSESFSYGVSGAIGFVKQLAKENSLNGITCNAINLQWKPDKKDICSLSDAHQGTTIDTGYLSLYLSTELASWISGHTIPLEIAY